jgi:hypothetical protein
MKKLSYLLLVAGFLAVTTNVTAQAISSYSLQMICKDALDNVAKNRRVHIVHTYLKDSPQGNKVWEEAYVLMSNGDGIVTVTPGTGTRAEGLDAKSFESIVWTNAPYYVKVQIAVEPKQAAASWKASDQYRELGTVQLLELPGKKQSRENSGPVTIDPDYETRLEFKLSWEDR